MPLPSTQARYLVSVFHKSYLQIEVGSLNVAFNFFLKLESYCNTNKINNTKVFMEESAIVSPPPQTKIIKFSGFGLRYLHIGQYGRCCASGIPKYLSMTFIWMEGAREKKWKCVRGMKMEREGRAEKVAYMAHNSHFVGKKSTI